MRSFVLALATVSAFAVVASPASAGEWGYSDGYRSSYSGDYSYRPYRSYSSSSYRSSDCCYRKVTKFEKVYGDNSYSRPYRSSYYDSSYSYPSYSSRSSYSYPSSYSYRSNYSYPSYSYRSSYNDGYGYGSNYRYNDGPRYSSYSSSYSEPSYGYRDSGYRDSYAYREPSYRSSPLSAFGCSRSVRYYDPEYGYRWGTVSRC